MQEFDEVITKSLGQFGNQGGAMEAKRIMVECEKKGKKIQERINADEFVSTASKYEKYQAMI